MQPRLSMRRQRSKIALDLIRRPRFTRRLTGDPLTVTQFRNALLPRLIAQHYAALTGFFRRRTSQPLDVQDLVQEVYLRLLRMDQSEGTVIHNPEAYLFTVANNLV